MKISDTGLQLIKDFEGLRYHPYTDLAGNMTIGFGHKIGKTESFSKLSLEDAIALLKIDLAVFEKGVSELCHERQMPQGQFDALVSFAFNVGLETLRKSTLLQWALAGNIPRAAKEFERWIYAGGLAHAGLKRRRMAEQKLFLADDLPPPDKVA